MRALDLIGGTEIVPEHDCWEMLADQSIGRVAFVHEGRVEVFPVNYALDDNRILLATNRGRKLNGLGHAGVVFEVDSVDPSSRSGWSVVVRGTALDVEETDSDTVEIIEQMSPSWTGPKDVVVVVEPQSITGRRVAPA